METLEFIAYLGLIYLIKVIAVFIFLVIIRPLYFHWGADKDEIEKSLPGDQLIHSAQKSYTRAININAPRDMVWAWLVQVGCQRAGWYNYEFINRLVGAAHYYAGTRSSDCIIEKLQQIEEGDRILLTPKHAYTVIKYGSPDLLLMHLERKGFEQSWVYVLEELGPDITRVIVRHRDKYTGWFTKTFYDLADIGFFAQERKHLLGIKRRAENQFYQRDCLIRAGHTG